MPSNEFESLNSLGLRDGPAMNLSPGAVYRYFFTLHNPPPTKLLVNSHTTAVSISTQIQVRMKFTTFVPSFGGIHISVSSVTTNNFTNNSHKGDWNGYGEREDTGSEASDGEASDSTSSAVHSSTPAKFDPAQGLAMAAAKKGSKYNGLPYSCQAESNKGVIVAELGEQEDSQAGFSQDETGVKLEETFQVDSVEDTMSDGTGEELVPLTDCIDILTFIADLDERFARMAVGPVPKGRYPVTMSGKKVVFSPIPRAQYCKITTPHFLRRSIINIKT
jgi:hypothetical protein